MTQTDRCGAEVFDGTEPRQCSRPASSERDGIRVCKQHAKLARLHAWGTPHWPSPPPVPPRTADDVLADFREARGFALYTTAGKIDALWRQPTSAIRGRVRTQRDEDALVAEYRTALRDVAIRTALELADLGLADDEIVGRLRTALQAA